MKLRRDTLGHIAIHVRTKFFEYAEFVKNYNPLVTRIIERDLAMQWLAETEEILRIIHENDKKYRADPSLVAKRK